MLTDKDEALENQRMVNRDLAKKLETALDKIPQWFNLSLFILFL